MAVHTTFSKADHPPKDQGRPPANSSTMRDRFQLLVECCDEREQRELFDELKARGCECRVLVF